MKSMSKLDPSYYTREIKKDISSTKEDSNSLNNCQNSKEEFQGDFNLFKVESNSINNGEKSEINDSRRYFIGIEENQTNKDKSKEIPTNINNNNINNNNIIINNNINNTTNPTNVNININNNFINRKRRKIFKTRINNTTSNIKTNDSFKKVIFKPKKIRIKRKKSKNRHDNAKRKVFNKCFKITRFIIDKYCKKLNPENILFKLNKDISITSKNETMKQFCKKTIKQIIYNDCPKDLKKREHNIKIIEKILSKNISEENSKDIKLFKQILNMTFGEILEHFLEDKNFIKEIEPFNSDFSTFSENFNNEYNEKRKIAIKSDFKNNILN